MSSKESSGAVAFGCLMIPVLAIASSLWRAWVLIRIYDWHIRALFGGPHWTISQAWAFSVFIGMFTYQVPPDVEEKKRTLLDTVARTATFAFLIPAMSLFVAWCLK